MNQNCFGHDFRKPLIEKEYGIKSKPILSGNKTSNAKLERIHLVLDNLVPAYKTKNTCIDKNYPCLVILAATVFAIRRYQSNSESAP